MKLEPRANHWIPASSANRPGGAERIIPEPAPKAAPITPAFISLRCNCMGPTRAGTHQSRHPSVVTWYRSRKAHRGWAYHPPRVQEPVDAGMELLETLWDIGDASRSVQGRIQPMTAQERQKLHGLEPLEGWRMVFSVHPPTTWRSQAWKPIKERKTAGTMRDPIRARLPGRLLQRTRRMQDEGRGGKAHDGIGAWRRWWVRFSHKPLHEPPARAGA